MDNYRNSKVFTVLDSACKASVRVLISQENWLEGEAVHQLQAVARKPGVVTAIGMPDLHPGRGQPIDAAVVSKNCLYPQLVGSDIACGMALWRLDPGTRRFKLKKWVEKLRRYDLDAASSHRDLMPRAGHVSLPLTDLLNRFGTIGGGNHFAEIQGVVRVFDDAVLAEAGLNAQSLVMLVHSGSRGHGQAILQQQLECGGEDGISIENARLYLQQHDFAHQWAAANRDCIASRLMDCIGVKGERLLDVSHNHVRRLTPQEVNLLLGEKETSASYWIHRKGASPVDEGLVMIPGSRGSLSYLVKPRMQDPANLAQGGFSLAHGAGRKWKRADCRAKLRQRFNHNDLRRTTLGGEVLCTERSLLFEEAPQAYKNIDVVVADLVSAGMVTLVASFRPLITYKSAHGKGKCDE